MPATPPRLLHVTQPTEAGVARCVLQYAVAQHGVGLDVSVACPPDGFLSEDLRRAGVPVLPWSAAREPSPTNVAGEVRSLHRLVVAHRPGLVHLHSAKAGLVGRLALRGGVPTVFQPHAWSFLAVHGPVRVATLSWERWAARWTSLLLCVSAAELAAGRAAGVPATRSAVVPNGVDLVPLPDRPAARRRLQLPAGPLVVCVGRLCPQKGQDLLLAAWPAVRAAVPDAVLVLVGDGPSRPALETAAGPGVRLVGARRDVGDWLAAADVVTVPSRWEGMALVPLEAMARARSVVAADVAGMRESVPPGGGAVVPPGDAEALATALVARLGGPVDADLEGLAGRAHVEVAHDAANTVRCVTAAYQAALG